MKEQFLNEIRTKLLDYIITNIELDEIIADYEQMYEDGVAKGLSHEEIVDYLGTPEKIAKDLSENYRRKSEGHRRDRNKLVALMPFLSTTAFFLLGFLGHAWHPGWLVFLSIPVTAILLNVREGFWKNLTSLSPFIAVTAFILLGTYLDAWNPGWLVFFLIPVCGVMTSPKTWQKIGFLVTLAISIGGYLYLGYGVGDWTLGGLCFILLFVYAILTGEVHVSMSCGKNKSAIWIRLTIVLSIAAYILFGILFQTWAWLWMVFLLIPMVAILTNVKDKNKLVALMPFISTILFFSLGFFLGLWSLSWLAFLLIPITAIIVNA